MDWVHADQYLRLLHRGLDGGHVPDSVVGFYGVKSPLAFALADILHIDKDPVHACGLRNLRDLRPVGNIHQLQHV